MDRLCESTLLCTVWPFFKPRVWCNSSLRIVKPETTTSLCFEAQLGSNCCYSQSCTALIWDNSVHLLYLHKSGSIGCQHLQAVTKMPEMYHVRNTSGKMERIWPKLWLNFDASLSFPVYLLALYLWLFPLSLLNSAAVLREVFSSIWSTNIIIIFSSSIYKCFSTVF